jgi:hypothetical protein
MKTIKSPFFYITILVLSLAACTANDEKTNVNTGFPADEVSLDLAKQYVKNYEAHAGTVDSIHVNAKGVADTIKNPNTRAIWFSTKRLRALLDSIEKEGGDGIRFYYATYNKLYKTGEKAPDSVHWGHNTLLMVSTKLKGSIHVDYYDDGKQGKNGSKGHIIGNPPENRGEMCPPPKNCDSVGATLIGPRNLLK